MTGPQLHRAGVLPRSPRAPGTRRHSHLRAALTPARDAERAARAIRARDSKDAQHRRYVGAGLARLWPVHVVLLGDSIFDNASYTRGEPDVVTHLRNVLPPTSRATLCAVDGATTGGLARQLGRVPGDATHLVVAIGGNDALQNTDLLDRRVSSTTEALSLFADRVDAFETAYRAALAPVLALRRPVIICTIYNGNLEARQARVARVALTLFNDAIVRFGFEHELPVIDLRLVCCDASDYANPIEPSGRGGLKIARAIVRRIAHDEGQTSL